MTTAQTVKSSKGFTLIELLVVISIIAILALIGVSVYVGAQERAKDGKRRAEIASIAKSIESSKDYAAGVYAYAFADLQKDFPQNLPTDAGYCIVYNTTNSTPPTNATTNVANGCPTGFTCPTGVTCNTTPSAVTGSGFSLPASVKSWTLCASADRGNPICATSLTR